MSLRGRLTGRQLSIQRVRLTPLYFLSVLTFLGCSTTGWAQVNPLNKPNTSQNAVCPLSEAQIQKSIEAFSKMVPTFTQEPRCVNCHGGVDPFAKPTNHGGDTQEPGSDCNDCHSEMLERGHGGPSKWQLPQPAHFFKGKDAKTLCKQMRDVFKEGADFIGHLIDDNGNSTFTDVAFRGTRGLNKRGRDLVDNYQDEPPQHITHGGLINLGTAWIDAMGGEFKGDVDCGCEPSHYAVRVTYDQVINVAMVHGTKTMGPVDIPIRFDDHGNFEGEQVVYINGNEMALMCTGESKAALLLRVTGQATEQFQKNHMHLQIESGSGLKGVATATCPVISKTVPITARESQAVLEKELEGRVGDSMSAEWGAGSGLDTQLHAQIVKVQGP
jgi:hypothetical protein